MNFDNLNSIRNSLFTAIEDAKLAVNTDQFNSKTEIVNQLGLQFALEAGALSQDERLQIEDLFSTTVLNKRQIIDMMIRILGVEVFNYGPGPQELIGGDMTNGYFGEVSTSELFTGNELASHFNLTQGTSINSDYGWLKFVRYGNIIYIAKKPLRHSTSWYNLLSRGLIYGNDSESYITKNDNRFICRLISGGNTNPMQLTSEFTEGSEWNETIYKVHKQFGDWEQFNDSELGIGNIDGGFIKCQEDRISSTGIIIRGRSITDVTSIGRTQGGRLAGWRPILALKQEDGSYSTGREHYLE